MRASTIRGAAPSAVWWAIRNRLSRKYHSRTPGFPIHGAGTVIARVMGRRVAPGGPAAGGRNGALGSTGHAAAPALRSLPARGQAR